MRRPTVLHCARDWVRPSEGFVTDVVRTTTATRAVVAYRDRYPGTAETGARAHDVSALARALPVRDPVRARVVALCGLAAAERAAVLHAHFGYWAEEVARAARRTRRPYAVSLHGHDALVMAPADAGMRAAVAAADLVVVPSRFLADAVSAWVPDEAIRVLPSGVELARLPFRERTARADGSVVVTFAGRFVAKKGVFDAARALAAARREVPGLRAVFVGTGPLEPELRRLLAELRLPADVRDGAAPGAVAAALEATDLLVTPSRTAEDGDAETLGLVNVEAMACGVPVVTTRHGGIPEVVDPEAAVLVGEGDVDALARAVADLARAPERWPAMGRAGRRRAALGFELGARVADLEEQYLALARTGRAAAAPPAPRAQWPTVSVVVPTHDRRALLAQTLDALAAQTYPAERVQVVVSDDGCRDGTPDLLRAWEGPWPLDVVRHESGTSAAHARNRGLRLAKGEVVAFTDDDCRPTPTWLEGMVAGLPPESGGLVQGRTTADPRQPVRPLSRTQWTPVEYGLYETANMAYTADVLRAVATPDGPFDTSVADGLVGLLGRFAGPFGEDTDLAWRARRAGYRSRFAAHAVVHHHVYERDVGYLFRRAVLAGGFPLVVRRIPELRGVFLWHRYTLGPHHVGLLAAAAGAAAVVRGRPAGALLAAPYAWRLLRPTRPGLRARLKVAPVLVARDAVELAACLYGSARTGTLVV